MLALGFLAGTHLHDRIIRAVEEVHTPQATATHVVLISNTIGIEAAWPRVRTWVADTSGAPFWRVPLILTPEQERAVWAAALARIGEPYDLPGLLWAGWYTLTGHPDRFLTEDRARVHCASLVVECLRAGGMDLFPGVPASNCTPALLAAAVSA